MANYFSGVHLALADLSSDSKARVLFTKQVKTGGGNVMVPRPGAFFGCKGEPLSNSRYLRNVSNHIKKKVFATFVLKPTLVLMLLEGRMFYG